MDTNPTTPTALQASAAPPDGAGRHAVGTGLVPPPAHPGTARHLRHRLNRMERYYADNRALYHLGMREQLDTLFEVAETPGHADDLRALLRAGKAQHEAVWRAIDALAEADDAAAAQATLAAEVEAAEATSTEPAPAGAPPS